MTDARLLRRRDYELLLGEHRVERDDRLLAHFPAAGSKPAVVLVRASTAGDGILADYRLEGESEWLPAHPATRFELVEEWV